MTEQKEHSPTRRKRTRKDPRRAITRKRLIDATAEIIRQRGAGALSVAAIARQAGVHPPGFYSYFKSLEECAQAAAEDLGAVLLSRYTESLGEGISFPTSRDRILSFIRLTLQEWLAEPHLTELVLRCRYERSPMGEVVRRYVDRASADLADHLREVAKKAGVIKERDPEEIDLLARLCFTAFFNGLASLFEKNNRDLEMTASTVACFTYDAVAAAIFRWREPFETPAKRRS